MLDQLFQNIKSPEVYEEQIVPSETDSPSNVTMVEGDSLVNNVVTTQVTTKLPTYQGSYEFPMETWKAIEQGKSPGLTKKNEIKPLNLDRTNKDFLFDLEEKINKENVNYVHTAFTQLERKPVIDKREVDLSTVPSLMKNPKYNAQLMQQALELESDPSLTTTDRFALIQSHHRAITMNGMLEHGRKIINDEIVATAKWAKNNPGFKGFANFFEKIIDGKGNFINEKDYKALIKEEHDAMIENYEKNTPLPKQGFWLRSDYNPVGNKIIYNLDTKKYETMDTRPKFKDSQEGWYGTREMISQGYWNKVEEFGGYKDVKNSLINAYNHSDSPSTKLRTQYYAKYGPNKGGAEQGELGTMDFDLQSKQGVIPSYGPNKGKVIIRPEVVELINIIQEANRSFTADNGIKIAVGGKTGSSPEKLVASEDAKTIIQNLWEDISTFSTRKKDATSRFPKGSLTFSSIVAGGEPYYAYNIKFKSDYIKTDRYIGTADNPGPGHATKKSPLFTDGITIYVPQKKAVAKLADGEVMSRLARDNKNASTVSAVEGLFSVKDNLQLTVPSGARMNLTRDPATGETRINGWTVGLNDITGKMDTIHVPLQVVPADRATDLDGIVNDFYMNAFEIFNMNNQIMKQLNKDKKVFDPKILQYKNQY